MLHDNAYAITFSFTSDIPSSICGDPIFSASDTSNNPLNATIFTFHSNGKLDVYTNAGDAVGWYDIKIKAHMGSYSSPSTSMSFDMEIVDSCSDGSLILLTQFSTPVNLAYTVKTS